MPHVLDTAIWASLTGPHAHLAEVHGQALRYQPDVTPFVTLRPGHDERAWADLAELVGPGARTVLAGASFSAPPAGWEVLDTIDGVQMVDGTLRATADPEAVPLGPDDVPEMLDLVARTEPGPFRPRALELGAYVGIRRDGKLIAMAGERLHPPGWTEISAVCTDPAYRRQGLATRLIRAVAAGIRDRGETPFLHTAAFNTTAIRLYESIGFTLRVKTTFMAVQVPGDTPLRTMSNST
jgi:ribosomal protein S18 acetylase RimI-like enzyme